MLELPEAAVVSQQLKETVCGKIIRHVTVNQSPHKFAFFNGDPLGYPPLLAGRQPEDTSAYGAMVELRIGDYRLVFTDGVNLRFWPVGSKLPFKHQLLLEFTGGTALSASVQMYGMLWLFPQGDFKNPYHQAALDKPSPLTEDFSLAYFQSLAASPEVQKLSLKAFLATQQRIPGLGNGVLQEILWQARLHPRRKLASLEPQELDGLHRWIRETLQSMVTRGGRDSEKDLFGMSGGYRSPMSSQHYQAGCPRCGSPVTKEAYLGGSVYYCPACQKL